jgi:CDGSH-type Zn-finger protein
MATYANEDRKGRIRTTMQLTPGERVKLCRCWRSATFPYCDEAHKQVADSMGPLIVEVPLAPKENESNPPTI